MSLVRSALLRSARLPPPVAVALADEAPDALALNQTLPVDGWMALYPPRPTIPATRAINLVDRSLAVEQVDHVLTHERRSSVLEVLASAHGILSPRPLAERHWKHLAELVGRPRGYAGLALAAVTGSWAHPILKSAVCSLPAPRVLTGLWAALHRPASLAAALGRIDDHTADRSMLPALRALCARFPAAALSAAQPGSPRMLQLAAADSPFVAESVPGRPELTLAESLTGRLTSAVGEEVHTCLAVNPFTPAEQLAKLPTYPPMVGYTVSVRLGLTEPMVDPDLATVVCDGPLEDLSGRALQRAVLWAHGGPLHHLAMPEVGVQLAGNASLSVQQRQLLICSLDSPAGQGHPDAGAAVHLLRSAARGKFDVRDERGLAVCPLRPGAARPQSGPAPDLLTAPLRSWPELSARWPQQAGDPDMWAQVEKLLGTDVAAWRLMFVMSDDWEGSLRELAATCSALG